MTTSIIIPAYNATSTIFKCLEALKKQTRKPTEVIIVDDGSKDGLEEKINRIKPKLKFHRLFFLKQHHKGVSEARNLGAKKAFGEILVFIDSDCVPGINWLENISNPFSNSKIGAVGGGYSEGIDNSFWQRFSHEELFFRRRKRIGNVVTLLSNNMAIRHNIFWEVGGFAKEYPVCEDMLISYKISLKYKIIWLKNNGVKHHFKNNFKDFLKHQYFFGKESTKFFLENPNVLIKNNHQGKQLHIAIGTSFLSAISLLVIFILFLMKQYLLAWIILLIIGVLLFIHILLYWKFICYLDKKKMTFFEVLKSYLISYCRDILAAFSFFNGLALYIKERKL